MNWRSTLIPLAAFVVMISSCSKDVSINYDHVQPRLVIQSRLNPDSLFTIYITTSLKAIDPSAYETPDGLSVSLFDVTDLTSSPITLDLIDGVFRAREAKPAVGRTYKIFAVAPGFTTVEATTSIPEPVELFGGTIIDLDTVESEVTPGKINVSYKLRLLFKKHTHSFFHFSFIQNTSINIGTPDNPIIQERAYYLEPQFPGEDGYYQHHEAGVLIDAVETNGLEQLEFSFVDYTLGEAEKLGNLYIDVRTVTPEYYYYFTSLARQLISRDDPFAEPVTVYNNIQAGQGNFSGFSSILYQIPIIP